jgi:hypothetical protein
MRPKKDLNRKKVMMIATVLYLSTAIFVIKEVVVLLLSPTTFLPLYDRCVPLYYSE